MRHRLFSMMASHPRVSLLTWLVISVSATLGASWLKFDFSPESVYSGQDEAVDFCNRHKQLFRFEDSVCLVVLEAADSRTLVRAECLEWVRDVGEQARLIDGVIDVTSLVTLRRPQIHLNGSNATNASAADEKLGRLTWVPLISRSDLTSDAALQDRVERMPLLNDLLISRDGSLLLIVITIDPARRGIAAIIPPVLALQQLLNDLPSPPKTRTHLSGVPLIRVDVIRSLQSDQTVMVPFCGALFLSVSLMLFRSAILTGISLLAVTLSVSNAVGLMGWTGQPFNLLSNVIPPLTLIIAAANTVHIVSRLRGELSSRMKSVRDVVVDVMCEMSVTCFLTLATTAIGFGSLLLARSELLQSLAVQAVLAMVCSYFSLMIVLTCGLTMAGDHLQKLQTGRSGRWFNRTEHPAESQFAAVPASGVMHRLSSLVTRFPARVALLHISLAILALFWARDLRVNSLLFETYDADNPIMKTIALLDEKLSGMVSLEIQLQADSSARFYAPEVIAALRQIRQKAESDGRITFYRDYSQVLAAFDSRLLSNDPETAASAAGRVYRMTERVDVSQVTRDFLAVDEPAARVMLRVHDIGSAGLTDLMVDVENWASELLPPEIRFQITGDAALHAVCMDVFIRDMFVSLIAASGVIFVLIAVLFRSIRIGLISTVPNAFPLVMTVAWMCFRGYDLNAGNVIVFAISLGIAVDDTIHFLARYREEIRNGHSVTDAVRTTIMSCGRAIVSTSILIVLGLSALVFSDFVPTRRFAELTAITMLAALPGDLMMLPALLMLFGRRRVSQRLNHELQRDDKTTRADTSSQGEETVNDSVQTD